MVGSFCIRGSSFFNDSSWVQPFTSSAQTSAVSSSPALRSFVTRKGGRPTNPRSSAFSSGPQRNTRATPGNCWPTLFSSSTPLPSGSWTLAMIASCGRDASAGSASAAVATAAASHRDERSWRRAGSARRKASLPSTNNTRIFCASPTVVDAIKFVIRFVISLPSLTEGGRGN